MPTQQKRKKKRPTRVVNAVSILIIVLSLFTIGTVALLLAKPFQAQGGGEVTLSGTTSKSEGYTAWTGDATNFLVAGGDKSGALTDVIMIVHFDNKSGRINILQIPRDTYTADVVSRKYNAIYGHPLKNSSGIDTLVAHIRRDFGISIQHYAVISTTGLVNLVNSVGGIDVYVPMDMKYNDPYQDLHINLKKGYQHLDGDKAEQFVRFRKGYAEGDLGRLETQKTFLAAMAAKLKAQSIGTLTLKVLPTLKAPNFATDMATIDLGQFGLAAKKVDLSQVKVYTMPGEAFELDNTSFFSVYKLPLVNILNEGFVDAGVSLSLDDLKIKQMVASPSTSSTAGKDFGAINEAQSSLSASSAKK